VAADVVVSQWQHELLERLMWQARHGTARHGTARQTGWLSATRSGTGSRTTRGDTGWGGARSPAGATLLAGLGLLGDLLLRAELLHLGLVARLVLLRLELVALLVVGRQRGPQFANLLV